MDMGRKAEAKLQPISAGSWRVIERSKGHSKSPAFIPPVFALPVAPLDFPSVFEASK